MKQFAGLTGRRHCSQTGFPEVPALIAEFTTNWTSTKQKHQYIKHKPHAHTCKS